MAPEVKFFQVRDHATNIPVMCVRFANFMCSPKEASILARAGWGRNPATYYVKIAGGSPMTQYDSIDWNGRTNQLAHRYIEEHWDELPSGSVVDVRVIAGEAETPAEFER